MAKRRREREKRGAAPRGPSEMGQATSPQRWRGRGRTVISPREIRATKNASISMSQPQTWLERFRYCSNYRRCRPVAPLIPRRRIRRRKSSGRQLCRTAKATMTTCALRDPERCRGSPSSFDTSSSTWSSSSSTRSSLADHRDLRTRAARACNAGARSSFRHTASGVTGLGRRRLERFARGNGEDSRAASEDNSPGASLDL